MFVAVSTVLLAMCLVKCGVKSRAIARVRTGEFNSMDYLAGYGYLKRANLETGALRSQAELDNAVREFQRMAGLKETGELDQKTIDKMKSPRCGMADMNSSSAGPQRFTLGPSKWDKNDITYRINNYTPDIRDWYDTRDSISQAFQIWSDVSPLTFRETTGTADIEISFAPGYHNDGYAFDGRGNVLAHAFPPGSGRGGDAHFDEDEKWTIKTQDGTNLYTVAAHEFGHSLGIYHSNVQGALMYPWYQGYVPDLKLSRDDVDAIQTLYGPRRDPAVRTNPTTIRPTNRPATPPTIPTVPPTSSKPPSDDQPNPCTSNVDAVTNIRGEVFAFKDKWFWRMDRNGNQIDRLALIRNFWQALPQDITYIDAVYERQDGKIVFFKGKRFWELDGLNLASGCPKEGKPLTVYGLDPGVTHIDAIFVWGLNRVTYIFSGYSYWRMNKEGTRVEAGYPRPTDMWTGIPVPFDTVFTQPNGKTHFLKGTEFWSFNDQNMQADRGFPKPLRELWAYCPRYLMQGFASTTTSSLSTVVVLTLLSILRNALI